MIQGATQDVACFFQEEATLEGGAETSDKPQPKSQERFLSSGSPPRGVETKTSRLISFEVCVKSFGPAFRRGFFSHHDEVAYRLPSITM